MKWGRFDGQSNGVGEIMSEGTPKKTVRVRIAVSVKEDGSWDAWGISDRSDQEVVDETWDVTVWIEADVPVPQPAKTIEGEVQP